MFKDAKPFQLVTIGIFLFAAVAGVLVFAFSGSSNSNNDGGPQVVIWGTANGDSFNDIIGDINGVGGKTINARYIQKPPENFNQELLEAIASGVGPDVVLLSFEDIFSQRDRLVEIPFSSYDERTFQDNFIQQAELFRVQDGYLGLPFALDPLVMYWNRDIFNSKNQPIPPQYWDTLVANIPLFTEVSTDLTITKSAISMGDFRNINHAKEILLALMFQAGSELTRLTYTPHTNTESLMSQFGGTGLVSSEEFALGFYTQFANPLARQYTWNRSLPTSQDLFAFGDLAMYIGLGSEIPLIRSKNPNLNFDVAILPQTRSASVSVTYGKMYGLAILSSSRNKVGSLRAIAAITSREFLGKYAAISGLPPVRRDLLLTPPADAYSPVLYQSAYYSKGWRDPFPTRTSLIFKDMIESQIAGRDTITQITRTAGDQLELLIEEFNKKNEK